MQNNNFKFADCIDCTNKDHESICSNCNYGEMFTENYRQVIFPNRNAESDSLDETHSWETPIEGFVINDEGEFEESYDSLEGC